jgi:alpha-beta hydrolase superfamily lysophospholipase
LNELAYERSLRAWMTARGMEWTRDRYRRAGGGDVTCYRLSPAGPPRAVVMPVHGAGNDALFALPGLIKRLLLDGYEVFSFDLDGHGRASTTTLDPETLGSAVPRAIRETGAGERGLALHGIGISLGGSLLLHALGAERGDLASGSLLAAPLKIELSTRAVLGEMGIPALRTLWREREHCGIWGLVPSFGPVKRGLYPLRLAVPPGPGSFGYVDVLNIALDRLDLEDAASRVRAPVLLAYGGADRVVPASQGERLHRLIPSSELLLLERETHLTTPLAPAVMARVREWIGGHAPAGPDRSGTRR